MNKFNKGIAPLIAIIIIVAVIVIGAGTAYYYAIKAYPVIQPQQVQNQPQNQQNPIIKTLTNTDLPNLVIYNGDGFGGLGRLIYDKTKKSYSLAGADFTEYVIDSIDKNKIRKMKMDEGGGAMAIPTSIKFANGFIFAMISSHDTILKLNPDFSILKQGSFGAFTYNGSVSKNMEINNGTLFFLQDNFFVACDQNLKEIGRIKIDNIDHFSDFIVVGNNMYFFEGVNTNPYTDCIPPTDLKYFHGCGEQYDVVGIIDIIDPHNMHVVKNEKVTDYGSTTSFETILRFKGIDPKKQDWLLVNDDYLRKGSSIELRSMKNISKVIAIQSISEEIFGLTDTAPFFAVINKNDDLFFTPITANAEKITIGELVNLNIKYYLSFGEEVEMKQINDRIFIVSGNRIRVVNTKGTPYLEFSQEIQPEFHISDFDFEY
ncbi:MAG TPA: archaellin/type IV pilin N-terminal domain-containing protein [Candidatus Wunengus sp. YC61]|uniref:archaellin/type IV pilin N-terminal domain-containing protein n=1 Tax=Candidatus Wunengus sp. YC61 TaxID=3367698 RepID=UPI0040292DD4